MPRRSPAKRRDYDAYRATLRDIVQDGDHRFPQKQLAIDTNMSQGFLSNILKGRMASLDGLDKIASHVLARISGVDRSRLLAARAKVLLVLPVTPIGASRTPACPGNTRDRAARPR
jgi:hypothetical protein